MMKKLLILSITIMLICHVGMAQQDGWIKYCVSDEIAGRVGTSSFNDMTATMRFTPEDLLTYGIVSGDSITKIALGMGTELTYASTMEIRIWEGGSSITDAGELVYTQPILNFHSFTENAMNEVNLTTPFVIDATKELRIGYRFDNGIGYPIGRDAGPAVVGKGDIFMSSDFFGGSWFSTHEKLGWDYNFSIKAYIEDKGIFDCDSISNLTAIFDGNNLKVELNWDAPASVTDLTGYSIYRDAIRIDNVDFTVTTYLDDVSRLGTGDYFYCIVAEYAHCIADDVCVVVTTVGINSNESSKNIIYPNPTTGKLIIDNGELEIKNIDFFDFMGKSVHSSTRPLVYPFTLDISHLPSGIYFIRIQTEIGTITQKIIKK